MIPDLRALLTGARAAQAVHAARTARDLLSVKTLRTLSTPARWALAGPDAKPRSVFMGEAWYAVKGWTEARLLLRWTDPAGPDALLAVRDEWIPGWGRRWEVLAAPEPVDADVVVDQASLLSALFDLAALNQVDEVYCRSNMARWTDPAVRDLLVGDQLEPFGTYLRPLSYDLAALRAGLHSKHRYQLRKAEAAGIEVRQTIDAATFATLMQHTYGRGGRENPFDEGYLSRLLDPAFGLRVMVSSAWAEGVCQAVVIAPYDADRGYYLHGATVDRPATGAAVLAHLKLMERLAAESVAAYDLGGARETTDDPRLQGIFRFKKRFGGEFERCARFKRPIRARPRRLKTLVSRFSR